VGRLELSVVAQTSIEYFRFERGFAVQARKCPYAVVVRDGSALYVLDMDGGAHETGELFADEAVAVQM
jgi:hypothetical protein